MRSKGRPRNERHVPHLVGLVIGHTFAPSRYPIKVPTFTLPMLDDLSSP